MTWKTLTFPLLLFLGAAAGPPPSDCGAGAEAGAMLPAPLDLAGRPSMPSGLTGQTFATLPTTEGMSGCRSPLPSASQSSTLQSESGDILHGLPQPDILRPIDEPKRAPQFQ
jgi:hypothetical protein